MRYTLRRGRAPWLAFFVCTSCLSACGSSDHDEDGTSTEAAGSAGRRSPTSTSISGGTPASGTAGASASTGAAQAGSATASTTDSVDNPGQAGQRSSVPIEEQGGASNSASGTGVAMGAAGAFAGASVGFAGGTVNAGGTNADGAGTSGSGETTSAAGTASTAVAGAASALGPASGGAASGGIAGSPPMGGVNSGGIGSGGVTTDGGANQAGATINVAGSSSIGPSTLPNPIHVVAGATLAGADGSLLRPFPDIAGAVSAIRATETSSTPWDGRIVVHRGRYDVATTIELPPNVDVEFQSGVTLALGSNVNFHANRSVKVLGTESEPVLFTWLTDGKHWGSFTLFVPGSLDNEFAWATFEHGGEVTYNGISVRGALSLESSGGHISHCTFQNNAGDDGLSLGSSHTMVDHSSFLNNSGDGIDVDGPGGQEISFCYFDGNGNDGLDTGEGADLWAHDNIMINSGDTGMEVGEASTPTIDHNIMAGNAMGIGIKDDADPIVFNNTLYNNQFGITAYHFKSAFGTGKGTIYNTIVWGSTVADVALVNNAPTKISYSCIQSGTALDSTNKNGSGNVKALDGEGLLSLGAGCDDPLFVNPAALDFHLRSVAGHFATADGSWLNDAQTSPCIDAGNPNSPVGLEPMPNGGRLNLGVFGGTAQASRSP